MLYLINLTPRIIKLVGVYCRKFASYTSPSITNGYLNVDLSNSKHQCINLNISSAWQDFYYIDDVPSAIRHQYVPKNQTLHINLLDTVVDSNLKFSICIPEYSNIKICGVNVNVVLSKKINGNIIIDCSDRSLIHIDKARGETIRLHAANGSVIIKKTLEGNIDIRAKVVDAKMINSEKLYLSASTDVKVEALYVTKGDIVSVNSVKVDQLRGVCNVRCIGDITLKGIDGSVEATSDKGNINIGINNLTDGSRTTAYTDGCVTAVINPEVCCNMECTSTKMSNISIAADSFQPVAVNNQYGIDKDIGYVTGSLVSNESVTNSSLGKQKFTSGKVNVNYQGSQQRIENNTLPKLVLRGASFVKVESLSWMEIIRRKHGLGKTTTTN